MKERESIEELINISEQRYEELLKAEEELNALYAYGVNNWDGYELAMEGLEEDRRRNI